GLRRFRGRPSPAPSRAGAPPGGRGGPPPISLSAAPLEVAPGGTITATWAGLGAPTAEDVLRLYALGAKAGPGDEFASWSTGAAPGGTRSLPLPADLPAATYELRLLTPDPKFYGLLSVVARSYPIRIAAPAVDLVVTSVATTPAQPAAGQPATVTVVVKNQGTLAAGGFVVDFYKDRAAAPGPDLRGDIRCTVTGLAPGASTQCTGTVTYAAAGTFDAWAQADTARVVTESDDGNNVYGPRVVTVTAPARPDLVVVAVGNPPASAAPG